MLRFNKIYAELLKVIVVTTNHLEKAIPWLAYLDNKYGEGTIDDGYTFEINQCPTGTHILLKNTIIYDVLDITDYGNCDC